MRKCLLVITGLICLLLLPPGIYAQTKAISGIVTDATGNPLAGVNVVVKSTIGTVTDAEGKFSLNAPSASSVTISFTGYKSQTLKVADINSQLSIQLEEDIAKLDEVIVTGMTTSVKRRNLANAIATVSSKQLSGVAPAQTLDAALNGKVPGAYINANSGAPGGGISVKLRGVTSVFGNTQPLYVIDGIFLDNSSTASGTNVVTAAAAGGNTSNQDNPSSRVADIRPEDIENIEILKGASAAAIYGSKAAGGVIIITTKKGKAGRTKISFAQDLGFVKVRKLLGVRQLTPERVEAQGWDVDEYNAAVAAGKIYDYEKELYGQTGFTRNSNLSITGGSDRTTFYFSASQKAEEGIVKRTGYRNSSIRLNLDHRISDGIKISFTSNYINSSADRGLTQNDNAGVTFGVALSSTPSFAELHPDASGNYPSNPFAASNPLQTRDLMTNNEGINRFITGVNIDATLQKSEKSITRIVARGGIDFYNLKTTVLFPSSLQFQAVQKGTSIQGATKNLNTNYIVSLVNAFTPTEKFGLTSSLGYTQENGDYDNLLNVATQVIAGQNNVDQAGALTASQFRQKYQDVGLFLQEEAAIGEALNLTAGVRLDKSTKNGDPNKYYVYPKGGISWNFSRMNFWRSSSIDNFKLRAAYGQSSNFPVFASKFTGFPVSNIGGFPGSLISVQRGEPGIAPERQTEFEAGFDIAILKGRLSFEATFYNKKIYDFLMQTTVPASSGSTIKWQNAGDLRNQGVELSLNAQPINRKNLKWTSTTNFWLNRSKVTRLDLPQPVQLGSFGTTLGTFQIEEGKTATQIIGIDDGTVKKLGDAEPRFQMNFFNELTFFENLSLRFLFHWKQGGNNINLSELLSDLGGTSPDYDDIEGNGKTASDNRVSQLGSSARVFVQPAGFFRMREIGLYYNFPKPPVNFVKGLRIGASLNNYFTFTKYKNYDPEVSNFGTGFSTGVDVMPFPSSKRGTFHIAIDF